MLHIVGRIAHANAWMRIAEYFGVPVEVIFVTAPFPYIGTIGKTA